MTSSEIRNTFLQYFKSKGHQIMPSAPIVNHNDPTLMFINAGMNPFKDFFLGNSIPENPRIADTQKCLRVSGKHNDLEEVGIDSYHQTMFEMLGNWSIGDYFKKEAIDWAWELLVDIFKIDPERLYATVFEGNESEGLSADNEAREFWKKYLPQERILFFDKKDNFWEMGDTGPCGPCSELHVDLRSDSEREKVDGASLVNKDNPLVIEIWNLVFIQYNRLSNGSLEDLPAKHIDTGMGFERLAMVLQGKQSNYETDIFRPYIAFLENTLNISYRNDYSLEAKSDIAMRVMVDHIRAVAITIADGALPSNTGAGYVVRRILRRAVRYYYSFLNRKEPILHLIVPLLADEFSDVFPELKQQEDFVIKLVHEEEKSFLRTLAAGLKRLDQVTVENNLLVGDVVFELYDTYGFPPDLTRLLAEEKNWSIDEAGFEKALLAQKQRGKADAKKETGDWIEVHPHSGKIAFLGYDQLEVDDIAIIKYREVVAKGKPIYQIVLNKTPFYPEGGGQVGDRGVLLLGQEKINVLDTKKENELIIHIVNKIPLDPSNKIKAIVDKSRRNRTENNHTATHLLHAALRDVLGTHVTQKGSLVNNEYLRFDFAHFQKMTTEELKKVEAIANAKIQENIALQEDRSIAIEKAKASGAMMLFGEKYGDEVRMITFDPTYSVELCGGCHVSATGKIGLLKIVQETSVAAGVRRIEALTGPAAISYVDGKINTLQSLEHLLKNPADPIKQLTNLQEENKKLQKEIEQLKSKASAGLKDELAERIIDNGDYKLLIAEVPITDSKQLKNIAYQLGQTNANLVSILGNGAENKATLMVTIDKNLAGEDPFHAGNLVKKLAPHIKGGGGGQAFFASAGGKNPAGINAALKAANEWFS